MTHIEIPDAVHDMLCERIETLQAEREALAEENAAIRVGVKRARDYAGDYLPAIQGLTVVAMLEDVMRGSG